METTKINLRLSPYVMKIYRYAIEVKGIDNGINGLHEVMNYYNSKNYDVWKSHWEFMFKRDDTKQRRMIRNKGKAILNKYHPELKGWLDSNTIDYVKRNNYFEKEYSNKHFVLDDFNIKTLEDAINGDESLNKIINLKRLKELTHKENLSEEDKQFINTEVEKCKGIIRTHLNTNIKIKPDPSILDIIREIKSGQINKKWKKVNNK